MKVRGARTNKRDLGEIMRDDFVPLTNELIKKEKSYQRYLKKSLSEIMSCAGRDIEIFRDNIDYYKTMIELTLASINHLTERLNHFKRRSYPIKK